MSAYLIVSELLKNEPVSHKVEAPIPFLNNKHWRPTLYFLYPVKFYANDTPAGDPYITGAITWFSKFFPTAETSAMQLILFSLR